MIALSIVFSLFCLFTEIFHELRIEDNSRDVSSETGFLYNIVYSRLYEGMLIVEVLWKFDYNVLLENIKICSQNVRKGVRVEF